MKHTNMLLALREHCESFEIRKLQAAFEAELAEFPVIYGIVHIFAVPQLVEDMILVGLDYRLLHLLHPDLRVAQFCVSVEGAARELDERAGLDVETYKRFVAVIWRYL